MKSTRSNGSISSDRYGEELPLPVLLGSLRRGVPEEQKKNIKCNAREASEPAVSRTSSKASTSPAQVKGAERFYYDKSTYTGTHKHGGPSTAGTAVGLGGYADLATLVARERSQDDGLQRQKQRGLSSSQGAFRPPPRRSATAPVDEFEPQHSIMYSVPSPRHSAGPERFYYDKSTYTGTHKNGGPQIHGSGVGKGDGYSDLSALVVRSHVQDDNLQRRKFNNQMSSSLNALLSPRLEASRHTFAAAY